jgi:hypothetical protein
MRRTPIHTARLPDRAGIHQQLLGHRGFPGVYVRKNTDVSARHPFILLYPQTLPYILSEGSLFGYCKRLSQL